VARQTCWPARQRFHSSQLSVSKVTEQVLRSSFRILRLRCSACRFSTSLSITPSASLLGEGDTGAYFPGSGGVRVEVDRKLRFLELPTRPVLWTRLYIVPRQNLWPSWMQRLVTPRRYRVPQLQQRHLDGLGAGRGLETDVRTSTTVIMGRVKLAMLALFGSRRAAAAVLTSLGERWNRVMLFSVRGQIWDSAWV
jgi:hypothetical protein